MKKEYLKIIVYLPAYVKSNRDLLRGILDYMEYHQRRDIEVLGIGENYEKNARRDFTGFNGAICYADETPLSKNILSAGIPTVVIFPDSPRPELLNHGSRSYVWCDSKPIGRAGARFLREKNAASYVFIQSDTPADWSSVRRDAFVAEMTRSGNPVTVLTPQSMEKLATLPRPVAIMAENDRMARKVVSASRRIGLAIPNDATILGVDDDDILCRTANPTISSVRMNGSDAGEKTAATLETMMRRPDAPQRAISYSFAGITERTSTASEIACGKLVDKVRVIVETRLASADTSGIKVPEIVNQLGISRRLLELDFRKKTGHTVHKEIVRLQLAKANRLLADGRLTIEEIAESCCFSSPSHFGSVYRRQNGQTPSEARRHAQ